MKYYLLRHEYPKPSYISGNVVFNPPLENYYKVGENLQGGTQSILLTMDKSIRKINVDFFLTGCGAFFASTDLAHLIQSHQKDIYVRPATSTYYTGKPTEKSYCLIHAPTKIDCFDYYRSNYAGKALALQRIERGEKINMIKVIQNLAIEQEKANGLNFFFIENLLLIDPVVSQFLADLIMKNKFSVNLEEF